MFPAELAQMYKDLRSSGKLSYSVIENAFENHQAKWPEAMFNEDAYFCYLAPLVDKGSEAYLSMLQGSKAEQRKWWLYNRFKYIDSKYNAGDALTDVITLRGYAKANVTITPYADIYPTVKFGSYLVQTRGARNVPYTLVCPLDNVNDTEIYIYSASQLSDIGDISGLKVGYAEFAYATKLQQLKIGDSTVGYTNPNLLTLYPGNSKLLKKIDVRNCTNFGAGEQKSLDLSGCSNIEEIYLDGTQILSCEVPNGGYVKKLHLPGTITNLTIKNQTGITEFVCPDYSHISTLNLENVNDEVDIDEIADDLPNGCRVRLFNFYWTFSTTADAKTFLAKFDNCTGIDEHGDNTPKPQIFATIHVATATGDDVDYFAEYYPDITLVADSISYNVKYYSYDGATLLHTESVVRGGTAQGYTVPARSSTAQYSYTGVGWNTSANASTANAVFTNIQSNKTFYAAYTATLRTYTVTFVNSNNATLQTVSNVPYGGTATYTGSEPSHPTEPSEYRFTGFSPTGQNITGNTTCVAQYVSTSSAVLKYLNRTLTAYESATASKIAEYAFYNRTELLTVETTATTIEQYAFQGCSGLTSVDLKATSGAVSIAQYAFDGCTKITELIIRSSTMATLANSSNTLPAYPFTVGNGAIYVPQSLVATYKANSNWAVYQSHIFAIEDYPVTNFDTIQDTWAQIGTKIANGTADYTLGDYKTIDLGTEGKIKVFIIGIEKDELSASTDKAKYTWWARIMPKTTHRMNPAYQAGTEGTGTIGGMTHCEGQTYLDTTIWALLPADLQNIIKTVKKYTCIYDTSGTKVANDLTTHKLFYLSDREVFNSSTYETQGPTYSEFFTSSASRIAYNCNTNSASFCWLRSASSASLFRGVTYSGSGSSNGAEGAYGVGFGFST